MTCLGCRTVRRYLCRAGHVLWSEQNILMSGSKQNNKEDKDLVDKHVRQEWETSSKKCAE